MAQPLAPKAAPSPFGGQARKSVVLGVVLAACAIMGGVWYLARPRSSEAGGVSGPAPPEPSTAEAASSPQSSSAPPSTESSTQVHQTATVAREAVPAAATVPSQPPVPPSPEPSAYTRALVADLVSLGPNRGPITPEQARAWKEAYQKLIREGAAALPAIRELLEKNVEINFKSVEGGESLGVASLRQAMFDAICQIGGPEAASLVAQVMQTTTNPVELALLAYDLEVMAPGQYRETAVSAARGALLRAAQDPTQVDTSPLFEVLQKFGGVNVLTDLEQASRKWNYYAPMVLATLPDGAGVASLERLAQNADGAFGSSSVFALRLLAQLGPQYPEAARALLNEIRTHANLSDSAWLGITLALSGEQMYYGGGYLPPAGATDPKTYRIPGNRQTYQSVNVAATWTLEQLQQQLALIDQVRAASPVAARMLEATRNAFAARLGQ